MISPYRACVCISFFSLLGLCGLGGCSSSHPPDPTSLTQVDPKDMVRVYGAVVNRRTNTPATGAILTVGSPKSSFKIETHPVDMYGRFDFMIQPRDQSRLYVWNGQGGSKMVYTQVDRTEIRTQMVLYMPVPNEVTNYGVPHHMADPWEAGAHH